MGLFDIFKEANEGAHGTRLESGFQETMQFLASMDDDLRVQALLRFLEKREKLLSHLRNMTDKGRIDMGRMLQDEARKKYDINTTEAYALWMAGAWLESMERKSSAARDVHSALEDLANKLLKTVEEGHAASNSDYSNQLEEEISISPNMPDITKCKPIKWFKLGDYSAVLVANVPNVAGIPAPFEYLLVAALISEKSSLPLYYVTAEKGFSKQVFLCAFDRHGNHSNYGSDGNWSDIRAFATAALSLIKKEINRLDEIPF